MNKKYLVCNVVVLSMILFATLFAAIPAANAEEDMCTHVYFETKPVPGKPGYWSVEAYLIWDCQYVEYVGLVIWLVVDNVPMPAVMVENPYYVEFQAGFVYGGAYAHGNCFMHGPFPP
ncbi:MAG: hypothetical protein LBC03_00585 [Nitrososphaerota archaeon]|jgi:hypothetical protein|nr:hypothetical protein [Nitrososphaerota archaeon]